MSCSECDRLREALRIATTWSPIETAPPDGYFLGRTTYPQQTRVKLMIVRRINDDAFRTDMGYNCRPRHWLPIAPFEVVS